MFPASLKVGMMRVTLPATTPSESDSAGIDSSGMESSALLRACGVHRSSLMADQLPSTRSVLRISMRSSPEPKTATAVECSSAAFTLGRSTASRRTVGEETT